MALIKCKECGKEISNTIKSCPHCGAKLKSKGCLGKFFKIVLYLIIIILAISIIVYLVEQSGEPKGDHKDNSIDTEVLQDKPEKIIWNGSYIGQEKCSMGRNKNERSNPYQITISGDGDELEISGIYFQSQQSIRCKIIDNELIIPEQNIGETSFIIRGKGIREGKRLLIEFEVDVIVNFEPKQYETNSCSAEFQIQ